MNEILELIGSVLALAMMISSVLLGLLVWLFTDNSKLTIAEKSSWYYWNKEILLKSIPSRQASLIWVLSKAQKISLILLVAFMPFVLVVKYVLNT